MASQSGTDRALMWNGRAGSLPDPVVLRQMGGLITIIIFLFLADGLTHLI